MSDTKVPFFVNMDDEGFFVKVDVKPGTDVTFGVTSEGNPFSVGEAITTGSSATEADFVRASKDFLASAKKKQKNI